MAVVELQHNDEYLALIKINRLIETLNSCSTGFIKEELIEIKQIIEDDLFVVSVCSDDKPEAELLEPNANIYKV